MVSHIFWPSTVHVPSSSRTALVLMPETSEPQPGSLIEKAPRTSPVAIRGRYLCFCSSVPCCSSMWATMKWVLMIPLTLIQPRAISSTHSA